MKYGPNTVAVERLIEQINTMTAEQIRRIGSAWDAALFEGFNEAQNAAWDAARFEARNAARGDVRDAVTVGDVAWNAVLYASREAVWALVVQDLISEEHFNTLYGPWASVFGPPKS